MRFLIKLLILPFRILTGTAGFVLRVVGLLFGFTYRALGYFSGRTVAAIMSVLIGLFLGRRHLREIFFPGKRR
jgi:hypothetical protein